MAFALSSSSPTQSLLRSFLVLVALLFAIINVRAQFPDGCTLGCNSNDVQDIIAFLGDADTIPLDIECTPGDIVNGVIIWIEVTFNSNSSREPIRWDGDVIFVPPAGEPDTMAFSGCINDGSTAGTSTVYLPVDTISWVCGNEVFIKNFIAGWSQPGGGQSCTDCPNNPKCIQLPDIFVQAPLVSNFTVSKSCVTDSVFQSITYTDATIGGIKPYGYSWNFGIGAFPQTANSEGPHTVAYSSEGTKTVSLTIIDSGGDTSGIMMDTVSVAFCCDLQVSCPATAQYQCQDNVPALPSSFADLVSTTDEADFNAIDGNASIVSSCRSIIVSASETNNGQSGCVGDTLIIGRTFIVYDDLNENGILEQNEIDRSDTCMQVIKIADDTPPTFTFVPADVTVECDAVPAVTDAQATDNCGVSVMYDGESRVDGSCPYDYTLTRTWTAVDNCGNAAMVSQTIHVIDSSVPDITALADDLTVECDGNGNTSDLTAWLAGNAGAQATDNCGLVTWSNNFSQLDDLCGATGSVQVTFTATDECNNQSTTSATFTIEDNTPPEISVAATDLTVECDGNGNAADLANWLNSQGGATASDICGSVNWGHDFTFLSDDCGATGSATVTFTVTDECNNASSTTATFTIVDTSPPDITTSASDLTVQCDGQGNITDLNNWLNAHGGAFASDICGTITWSSDFTALSDDCGATGSATVTFTVTDECNNASATTATFTIIDTAPPDITTPANDLTVQCDGQGNVTELNNWLSAQGGAIASDICGSISWSSDFTALSDDCGATGSATVTFTVTDECNNASATTATFTIIDTAPPDITTSASDLTVECDGLGNVTEFNNWLDSQGGAVASDICGSISWSNDFTALSDDCGATGSATVTFTVTDECNNASSTTATFTIIDTTTPDITTSASDLTVECDGQGNVAQLNNWLNTQGGAMASDACGNISWSSDFTMLSDDCGETGFATVTFTVTDECNNASSTTATFTIVDTSDPFFTFIPADITVECDAIPPVGTPVIADDCDAATPNVTFSSTTVAGACPNAFTINRSWVATDACGNQTGASQQITVEDNTAPDLSCPDDLVLECSDSADFTALIQAWLGSASATDNCGIVAVSTNYAGPPPGLSCDQSMGLAVTFSAVDSCGNASSCVRNIYVDDTTPPVIVVTDSILYVDCEIDPELANEGFSASDACSDVDIATVLYEGFCNTELKNVSSGSGNAYSPTNWFKIEVEGLNETLLDAADIQALDLLFEVSTSQGGNGGKGQVEFWLVNPCNEAIRIIGPYCVNNSNDPNDLGCEQQGLFNPVFEFTDPCRPSWHNADVMDNTGVQEKFAPFSGISGPVTLGNLAVTAVEQVADFTCTSINGDWYIFGVKDNSENASIQFQRVCLQTCPEAFTREITATDSCNNASMATQLVIRADTCTDCGTTWYVDSTATGGGPGTTWADAFTDLQDALYAAVPGDQIWVAEGTYFPTATDDRTVSFQLVGDVGIYGGFAGGETELGQRDPAIHPTILSGEIGAPGTADNSYHVVVIPDCVLGGHLEGFIVEGGNANGTGPGQNSGGGVFCQGEATLALIEIRNCDSTNGSNAVFNDGAEARLTLEACTMHLNGTPGTRVVLNVNGAILTMVDTTTINE